MIVRKLLLFESLWPLGLSVALKLQNVNLFELFIAQSKFLHGIHYKNITMDITTDTIHLVISDLIQKKAKRDRIRFTSSQLAQAIRVKRSLIQRLIHADPNKRVTNPKIETLVKIVDYFRSEGFSIGVDNLLAARKTAIDVQEQTTDSLFNHQISIPLYTMYHPDTQKIGTIDIKITDNHGKDLIAILSEEDLKPIFKRGSIFIIDHSLPLEQDSLVAVQLQNHPAVLIRKYSLEDGLPVLRSYDSNNSVIALTNEVNYKILGVVIQVNAKT